MSKSDPSFDFPTPEIPKPVIAVMIIMAVVFVIGGIVACRRTVSRRNYRTLNTEAYLIGTTMTDPALTPNPPALVPLSPPALPSSPPAHRPSQATKEHTVVQSTGGQVVLSLEGGFTFDEVRAQQERVLARYTDAAPRDPQPTTVIAQEQHALGRHVRNDIPSTSFTSQLFPPVPSSGVPATARTSIGKHTPDPDLRAQVHQLQEEVERLRTERVRPLQELPPAYQSDLGSTPR
jgi:hypothetical protein